MTSTRPITVRTLRLRGAEVLIWVAIAASGAFALSAVLGPNGLGLVTLRPEWPVVGQSAYQMSIESQLNDDAVVSVANTPRWQETSDGTRDAVTGGPPVEVTGPFTAQLGFLNATFGMRSAWIYRQAAGPLLTAVALLVVLRIVRSVRFGTPFTATNARRLRTLALLVGVGGTVVTVSRELVRRWLLDGSAAAGIVQHGWSVTVTPLLVGVIIGVVAQVWRTGVVMSEELDGVV